MVMQALRAVANQTDEEIVLFEERGPSSNVPLVWRSFSMCWCGFCITCFQSNDFAEELPPEQRRFAALPTEHHLVARLRLDVLAEIVRCPIAAGAAGVS